MKRLHLLVTTALLFGSGFCALVYQIVWIREFRLIFGAATAATAAVLAIFIGGLGAGGLWLGRVAERKNRPLQFYARLEVGIALTAALTPFLLWGVRQLYILSGGSVSLGMPVATGLRLLLSTIVLAVPTVMMGGTLPAVARAVEDEQDPGRRRVALLYGINTLGAVTGCMAANFLMLEIFGAQRTLWIATLFNLLVAVAANSLGRSVGEKSTTTPAVASEVKPAAPRNFVLAAAWIVGFAFFLMEMVWFRMLGPILGGTVFTFGLILAVALLGIGLGGWVYSLFGQRHAASPLGFAYTCALEAAFIAVPFAIGDGIAKAALLLQPLGHLGFWGYVAGWTLITVVVVLPAAFIAGIQFPMLIALLGQGSDEVGKQTGQTYAFNSFGAIVGSLAGGFGLLPLLGALGCWRLLGGLLGALALAAVVVEARRRGFVAKMAGPIVLSGLTVVMLGATGPTAAWRHAEIGAGRASLDFLASPNRARQWVNANNFRIQWEGDGIEGSVAVAADDGLAFVTNGRIDGNAIGDAPTCVMMGMLGALLHGDVKRAFVVGVGTGTTAGWLGKLPSVEQVDVAELEPLILKVAKSCGPVNQKMADNPKVNVIIGDAREILLTTPSSYDLIVSEPSNPHRAGIASLFTREFYQSVADRLRSRGLFCQWVQSYNINAETLQAAIGTLGSVYPHVEIWHMNMGDLLLVATKEQLRNDAAQLRRRLKSSLIADAAQVSWKVTGLEGVLAHHLGGRRLVSEITKRERLWVNTDDLNHIEFGFARDMHEPLIHPMTILSVAKHLDADRPLVAGAVDWDRVEQVRTSVLSLGYPTRDISWLKSSARIEAHTKAFSAYRRKRWREAASWWKKVGREPSTPAERLLVAEAETVEGDAERARSQIVALRRVRPTEADYLSAALLWRQRSPKSVDKLVAMLKRLRSDPWVDLGVVDRALNLARVVARQEGRWRERITAALHRPFSLHLRNERRLRTMLQIELARKGEPAESCVEFLAQFEPHVVWNRNQLHYRSRCYARHNKPLAEVARRDFAWYRRHEGKTFGKNLR